MFDYYTATPVQIFNGLKEVENSARPYALTVILLTTAVTVYTLGKLVFGRKGHAMYSKASRAAAEKPLGRVGGVLATGAFAGVALLAVSPHLGVVLTSITQPGQWYQSVLPTAFTGSHFKEAMTASDAFGAIWNSIALSGMAVLIDLTAGLVIAYLLVRTNVRGKAVLDALCMLPLAVPGLVMAFGYVAMSLRWPFGKDGPLSGVASIFAADPNPVAFLVTAYAVRRLPYIVRSTVAGLEQTSGELEEAAINLGASRLTAVRRVIVPLIMANLIAGAAGLRLLDAGGERLADSGPAAG